MVYGMLTIRWVTGCKQCMIWILYVGVNNDMGSLDVNSDVGSIGVNSDVGTIGVNSDIGI